VLIRLRCISTDDLEETLRHRPVGQLIGEYLVEAQKITEANLCQALSSQSGLPMEAWTGGFSASRLRQVESRSAESLLPEHSPHPNGRA